MKTKGQDIHLAIAFDKNYLAPFYALVTSVFENNSAKIIIHAIISGLSENEKRLISDYVNKFGSEILFYSIDEATANKFVLTGKWTSAVYYRLYFPLLVPPSIQRILYLDTDTLVLNDLSELYAVDLSNHPVGAVYDNWVKTAPQLGITDEGRYFNSGVLLIDVAKWNEQKISEKSFAFLQDFPEKIQFVDQDALNAVLKDNWKKLEVKYNLMYSLIPEGMSIKQMQQFIEDKVIIHFTLSRPWHLLCTNRYRHLYFFYLKKSPYRKQKAIIDFAWQKVPKLLKIRSIEVYNDLPVVQKVWRGLRNK